MHCSFITILIFVGGASSRRNFICDTPDEWLNVYKGDLSGRTFERGTKWPNAIVTYRLSITLTAADKVQVLKSFEDIEEKTCIRFQPRSLGGRSFTEIVADDKVCGVAHVCRTGGQQYAKFGGWCKDMNTMVHELGHMLCLGHEHQRPDRDEHLDFSKCPPEKIPGKSKGMNTRGTLYDYASQMHYQCGYCGLGGWPKFGGANIYLCGSAKGLSVLDADKLNEFYECGGCYGHRWIPFENLKEKVKELLPLGQTQDGRLLYACRGHIDGKIAIGKYVQSSNVCYLPFAGKENRLNAGFEVLSVPEELKDDYILESSANLDELYGVPVKGGRSQKGDISFVSAGLVTSGGYWEKSVGETFESERHLSIAYFPWKSYEIKVSNFSILTCTASF